MIRNNKNAQLNICKILDNYFILWLLRVSIALFRLLARCFFIDLASSLDDF